MSYLCLLCLLVCRKLKHFLFVFIVFALLGGMSNMSYLYLLCLFVCRNLKHFLFVFIVFVGV